MSRNNEKELLIKNMVCPRCIMVVRETLQGLGYQVLDVELGKARITGSKAISIRKIDEALQEVGFELLFGKNQQLVEQIKSWLIHFVKELEEQSSSPNISDYLQENIHQNYSSLSAAFSKSEQITIEKYLIHLKIERVKELLSYGELTLGEIAFKLNYSNVSYLSNQFKQITGMSVTDYKKARDSFRQNLDDIHV
jgi:YesN/AraC family two-component response regulator